MDKWILAMLAEQRGGDEQDYERARNIRFGFHREYLGKLMAQKQGTARS